MSEDKKYNGYTNYETWLCALWLDNDQGSNEMISEKANELVNSMDDPHDEGEYYKALREMSDYLEMLVEEMHECSDMPNTGMFADFLNAALKEIDYRDIAGSQLADPLNEARKGRAA